MRFLGCASLLLWFLVGASSAGADEAANHRTKRNASESILDAIGALPQHFGQSFANVKDSVAKTYSIYFVATVSNYLTYPLVQAKALPWYGVVSDAPIDIRPCYHERFAGHKTGYTATGTSGIASWRVQEMSTTIIIFWDLPYGPSSSNHLAVGIFTDLEQDEPRESDKQSFFDYLYFGPADSQCISQANGTAPRTCNWAEYSSIIQPICTSNNNIEVCGSMGSSSTSSIDIDIKPTSMNYLVSKEQCQ